MMGSLVCSMSLSVDMHDNRNMPFSTVQQLFVLANRVTRDKVKQIKVEYWTDESQLDALCVYQFRGWLSSFSTSSGSGTNHILNISLQPALDSQHFIDLQLSN